MLPDEADTQGRADAGSLDTVVGWSAEEVMTAKRRVHVVALVQLAGVVPTAAHYGGRQRSVANQPGCEVVANVAVAAAAVVPFH